jgi:hypothetical protein
MCKLCVEHKEVPGKHKPDQFFQRVSHLGKQPATCGMQDEQAREEKRQGLESAN